MRNKMVKFMSIIVLAVMVSACGNTESKVDQVIQNQIQETENKNSQSASVNETETDALTETTEAVQPDSMVEGNTFDDNTTESNTSENSTLEGSIDVDLTKLSSTMVYSEVYNMMYTPNDYIGKTVKMTGMFVAYTNQDASQFYPAVIIADATACCSQGLEFLLEGNPSYPEGYPEMETEITVVGTFETYDEDGDIYCRLQNARIE